MKRTIWITLVLLLICVLVLSACDSGDTPPSNEVTNQTGSNNDGGNNEGDDPSTTCQHTSSDWIIDKAATCKEAGSKHKECTECEEVLETASIDKLATHTPGEAVTENYVDSDCETEGSYNLVTYCSVCNKKLSTEAKTVEKKPHTSSDWIIDKDATCKEAGSKHKECTKCEEVLETASIDKHTTHTPVIDSRVEPTFTSTGLTEGSHCGVCGVVIVAQDVIPMIPSKTTLATTTLALDGRNISGSFSYATEIFNFVNDIIVTNNSPWVVSTDSYGMQTVATKIVPLNEGNNIFYIHVTNPDQTVSTYTVNIYRNHLYTVSFNTNGGTGVSTQHVEEGYLAQQPTTTRAGYTFSSWDYDFSSPIRSNITINANWNANENTPYKVEYYRQNLDRNGYELIVSETEVLAGKTDTTAYAEQKIFEHFTLNRNMSALSGNIDGDGSLVLKLYYTRDTYTISLTKNNTKAGTITSGGTYAYDKSITITATTNAGYTFLGWYEGETKISDNLSYSFNVDHTAAIKAKWETNVYNITYELNGGANNEHNVATYTVETPTIVLGSPERTGYEFNGWFADETFTTQATVITLGSYGEKTFYAKWTPIVYKITYDHNYQGSTTDSAYTITNNSTYPWNVSNGVLISSNKANSSSATYKIVANAEITVSFKYKVSSESNYDFLTIVQNGTQVAKISGSTAYESYSTTLYAGEYITFTYSKDNSQYSGNDCAYISDLVCNQTRYTTEAEYNIETSTFDLMIPERAGYIFKGWFTEGSFENQVSSISTGSHGDKMLYAKWEARTDTPYRVEYYLENVDKNGYDIVTSETEYLTGITDTIAHAEQKSFEHFVIDSNNSDLSGNIDGNSELVLRIYYTRNIYYVTSSDTSVGSVSGGGNYAYDKSITVSAAVAKLGYQFVGWYSGDEFITSDIEYTFNVDRNIIAKFEIVPEMQNFIFSSTSNTCSITGIKDKSVTQIVVPNYVTCIYNGAFGGCSSLESLTLPFVGYSKSATTAGESTLFGYIFGKSSYEGGVATKQYYTSSYNRTYYIPASLKHVTITGGDILRGAFYNCGNITTVTLGDGTNSIQDYAFYNCTELQNVTISSSVLSIDGYYIFNNCDNLVIFCESLSKPSGWASSWNSSWEEDSHPVVWGYTGTDGTDNLGFKWATTEAGVVVYGYSGTSSVLDIPDTINNIDVVGISDSAFLNNLSICSVKIPGKVYTIGDSAFYGCSSLASIELPDSITNIGASAFSGCSLLVSVKLPNHITSIGSYAFSGCSSLLSVEIPDGVTVISSSTFSGCSSLVSVKLPNHITSIGSSAFSGCSSLVSIAIPDSVISIDDYAFSRCTSLNKIIIPVSVSDMGYQIFGYCTLTVYCRVSSAPSEWDAKWDLKDYTYSHPAGVPPSYPGYYYYYYVSVVWGYTGN